MDELKPCPFCGSNVELFEREREFDNRILYSIACNSVDCFLSETDVEPVWFSDKKYMVTIWNSRINQPFVSDCVLNGNAAQEMLDDLHEVDNG